MLFIYFLFFKIRSASFSEYPIHVARTTLDNKLNKQTIILSLLHAKQDVIETKAIPHSPNQNNDLKLGNAAVVMNCTRNTPTKDPSPNAIGK